MVGVKCSENTPKNAVASTGQAQYGRLPRWRVKRVLRGRSGLASLQNRESVQKFS